MPHYDWTRSASIPGSWVPFDTSTNPPLQVVSLPTPVSNEMTLRRTVADIEYCMLVTAQNLAGSESPSYGAWGEVQVTASIWVDPTGLAIASQVPKPFLPSGHIPPQPVWEGTLYGHPTPYSDIHLNGWVVSFRPLEQIESEAQRKQLTTQRMTSWLSVQPRTGHHWDASGVIQEVILKYSISQLWSTLPPG